jgi:hypothetical protein
MIWLRVGVGAEVEKLEGSVGDLSLTSRMVVLSVVTETTGKMNVLIRVQIGIDSHQEGVAGDEVDRVGKLDRVEGGMVKF